MSQKSGFLIVSNGFFIENVGHTLTKNYNGTYWPLTICIRICHKNMPLFIVVHKILYSRVMS